MADESARGGIRRFIPYRIRWAVRVCWRLITGWYIRNGVRRMQELSHNVAVQSSQIEAQSEMMDFFLRRLQRVEEETVAIAKPMAALRSEVADLKRPLGAIQQEVIAWSQPIHAITGKGTEHDHSGHE